MTSHMHMYPQIDLIHVFLFKDSLVDFVLASGLPHAKLTIGIPAYGVLYRMDNTSHHTPGSKAIPFSGNETMISHSKVFPVAIDVFININNGLIGRSAL